MQPTTGNLVADTICRTAEIGLTITGAADAGTLTIIDAAPVTVDGLCPECGNPGKLRDHIVRTLVDLPVVGFPTRLHVRVPRFTCSYPACGRKIFQASLTCADDGAKLTHRVTRAQLKKDAMRKPREIRLPKGPPLPSGEEKERLLKRSGEWSQKEDQDLTVRLKKGETLRSIANHLGKTISACIARKRLLGL